MNSNQKWCTEKERTVLSTHMTRSRREIFPKEFNHRVERNGKEENNQKIKRKSRSQRKYEVWPRARTFRSHTAIIINKVDRNEKQLSNEESSIEYNRHLCTERYIHMNIHANQQ